MGIAKGHGQGLVTQQRLDRRDVDTRHYKMTGEGMPKVVEPKILDPCPPAGRIE